MPVLLANCVPVALAKHLTTLLHRTKIGLGRCIGSEHCSETMARSLSQVSGEGRTLCCKELLLQENQLLRMRRSSSAAESTALLELLEQLLAAGCTAAMRRSYVAGASNIDYGN